RAGEPGHPGSIRRAGRGRGAADRRHPRHGRLPRARSCRAGAPLPGVGVGRVRITCVGNGQSRTADDVWAGESLLYILRERLGLYGSKNACEQGECGSCSVYVDGTLVCACLVLGGQAQGRDIVTVEGIGDGHALHPVQPAFVEAGAVQCGFCTPGLIVAAHDLMRDTPWPNTVEIREALAGNICRCTGYAKILDAVHLAAERMAST